MDAALGANADPTLPAGGVTLDQGTIAPAEPQVGAGETAAYGETVADMPALDEEG